VFCVVEGTLTMFIGDPPERFELPPRSLAVVESGTPLQLRNESDSDVLVFAYGAPQQDADYSAEVLPDAESTGDSGNGEQLSERRREV
jgi:hypothetical protein